MVTIERRMGIVRAVRPGEVIVRIQQQSACTGCHAKEFCCSTDCADRDITIRKDIPHLQVGDTVVVEGRDSIGRIAVFLSFVIPILLFLSTLILGITLWNVGELWSIFYAFLALAIYYGILRLLEPYLRRLVQFEITKAE